MNKEQARAIFFDLDGTLVDSAGDLATSVNHALSVIEKPMLDEKIIRSYIGNGADRLIHRAITRDYEGIADPELYQPAKSAFLKHYANNICTKSALYPGVEDVLQALREHSYQLACITNKPSQFTLPLLEALHVSDFFKVVLSGDSLNRKKPAPDQLQHAAEQLDIAPAQCLMIGDTNTDISAAMNCGMPAVFVTYGYGLAKDLDQRFSGPHIDRMPDLHHYL